MMNAFTLLISILTCLLPCFFIFFGIFADKLRLPLWTGILICCALTAVSYASGLIALQRPGFYPKWKSTIALFFVALFIVALFSIFKYSIAQQLFFLFMLRNYLDIVDLFLTSMQWLVFGRLLTRADYCYLMMGRLLLIFISAPLLWLFTKKILRPILDRTEHMEFWKLIWLIPFFHFLIFQLSIDITGSLGLTSAESIVLPPIWAFCTFLTYYLVLHMISETAHKNQITEQLHISEIQIISQEKHFEALKEKIEYTRRAQHDLRHFLLGIQKYAGEKDCEGLEKYLRDSAHLFPADPLLSAPTSLSMLSSATLQLWRMRRKFK